MNRRQADRIVGAIVGAVLLVGLVSTGQLFVSDDPMMGDVGSVPAIHVLGPLLVSLLVAASIAAAYALVRDDVFRAADAETATPAASTTSETDGPGSPSGVVATDVDSATTTSDGSDTTVTITRAERRVLDLLPEDERRILGPVIESPGITQTAVADRADYSRSKVSQTVTDLEERGLLYRERQGRTYRVYPADDFGDRR
ncbi:helix-turn-helix transcriptional regulator [Halorubrum sp. DTA46]|uniref:helix-turn-helix transcriptional regulator n=1 Tax=Halorubrum sp. DTA46 TaxID=3402162 RepID=UPI003AACF243